ncbi:MAG: ISKra4 family transposase, partial [Albidovulum sp.]|nr:ISKra4 family transposase [Albidovulum sp.]
PRYRAAGLPVGSGVIEGACRSVVCERLKKSGMYWSVAGANKILALRCAVESNTFDDFWEFWAEEKKTA